MEKQAIRNHRVSPDLIGKQFSLTIIPNMLYQAFSKMYGIGEEQSFEYEDQNTYYKELQVENEKDKVWMLHSMRTDGDATETKFALLTWEPSEPNFGKSYEFEIIGKLASRGWSFSEGNKFNEELIFRTQSGEPLQAKHSISLCIATAIIEANKFASKLDAVSQTFIDHAPKSPR